MIFRQRVPRPPLDTFVAAIWLFRTDPRPLELERILPSGAPQLIVNLKEDETRIYDPDRRYRRVSTTGTILSGAHSRYRIIDTSEQEYVAGVAFKPGGAAAFMRTPADETRDMNVALEDLWGQRPAADLREQLLERATPDEQLDAIEEALQEMWAPSGLHPAVAFALNAFDCVPHVASIASVTNAIGLSAKRFIERFKAEVGLTPKRYCRVRRFQRALRLAHEGHAIDWTGVALDCGYFDQAHLIHDFRAFAGVSPTGYQAARTPFQNHVKFLQSDADAL